MNSQYFKFCPTCNCSMEYSTKKGLQDSIRAGRMCQSCCKKGNNNAEGSNRKEPFRWLFTKLQNSAKRKEQLVSLSYEEFFEFTKIDKCHYCNDKIEWPLPHLKSHKVGMKVGYHLDRKDNSLGYTKDNCVVACIRCNDSKSSNFGYEEWYGMTEIFRK